MRKLLRVKYLTIASYLFVMAAPSANCQLFPQSDSVWLEADGFDSRRTFDEVSFSVKVLFNLSEATIGAKFAFSWDNVADWRIDSVTFGPASIDWEIKSEIDTAAANQTGLFEIKSVGIFFHTAPGWELHHSTIYFSQRPLSDWNTGASVTINSQQETPFDDFWFGPTTGGYTYPVFGEPFTLSSLDLDSDGFADQFDNCPEVANEFQIDQNQDGIGDICQFPCGDITADSLVTYSDISALVEYYFHGSTSLATRELGDVNCDGIVNLQDIMNLISFVNGSLPELCCYLANPREPDVIYMYQRDQK